ncbi:MAG: ThiF family adenylyltransferase [Clostridia bacterium]|nr:ThiF family adenylyltransferase [Clostridia bacterium]
MGKFDRTRLLLGDKIDLLNDSKVALFGVGGVGGFTAEALVRSGIGNLTIFDGDKISESTLLLKFHL